MTERVALEEMAGQAQAVAPIAGRSWRVFHQERRQAHKAALPDARCRLGHRPSGARRDPGQAAGFTCHGTAGKIQTVAEIGQQRRFPAYQLGQHRRALRQPRYQMQQAAEHTRMRLAFRQRAFRDRTDGGEHAERQRVVHRQRRGGMDQLGTEAAELVGEPGDPAHLHQIPGLPDARCARARPRRGQARGAAPCSSVITVATASPSPYGRASSTMAGASHSISFCSVDRAKSSGSRAPLPPACRRTRPAWSQWRRSDNPLVRGDGRRHRSGDRSPRSDDLIARQCARVSGDSRLHVTRIGGSAPWFNRPVRH